MAWNENDKSSAGNGALMRSAPIGIFTNDLIRPIWAISDSLITHADPKCILANVLFTEAISQLIKNIPIRSILSHIKSILKDDSHIVHYIAYNHIYSENDKHLWKSSVDMLLSDLIISEMNDPRLYIENETSDNTFLSMNKEQIGFVRVAFRLAFWQLIHAKDFQSGLIDTVNRGGDTDTNGAIVGALLGAKFGYNSLPKEWVDTVLNCNPPKPWSEYHPKIFITSIEKHYS